MTIDDWHMFFFLNMRVAQTDVWMSSVATSGAQVSAYSNTYTHTTANRHVYDI